MSKNLTNSAHSFYKASSPVLYFEVDFAMADWCIHRLLKSTQKNSQILAGFINKFHAQKLYKCFLLYLEKLK
jgi:hypothetical protein